MKQLKDLLGIETKTLKCDSKVLTVGTHPQLKFTKETLMKRGDITIHLTKKHLESNILLLLQPLRRYINQLKKKNGIQNKKHIGIDSQLKIHLSREILEILVCSLFLDQEPLCSLQLIQTTLILCHYYLLPSI